MSRFITLHDQWKINGLCGGVDSCATCKSEAEGDRVAAENEKFDNQLWTFIAVNNETGAESILYGHATNNVFIYALAKAEHENSWLKVTKYETPKTLDAIEIDLDEIDARLDRLGF